MNISKGRSSNSQNPVLYFVSFTFFQIFGYKLTIYIRKKYSTTSLNIHQCTGGFDDIFGGKLSLLGVHYHFKLYIISIPPRNLGMVFLTI